MTANRTPDRTDADLIRYIDGELSADERARVDAEIAADATLADRFATLRRRSTRLRALLESATPPGAETRRADPSRPLSTRAVADEREDPAPSRDGRPGSDFGPVPAVRSLEAMREPSIAARTSDQNGAPTDLRHTSGPRHLQPVRTAWLKAAVLLVAVSLGAVLVPPVRAWIVQQLKQLAPSPAETPSAMPSAEPQEEPGVLDVEFDVGPSMAFEITLGRFQTGGELRIRSARTDRARATRVGGGSTEEMLVSSQGLQIRNAAKSSARYEVVLPERVRSVSVRIGGRPPVIVRLDGSGNTHGVSIVEEPGLRITAPETT